MLALMKLLPQMFEGVFTYQPQTLSPAKVIEMLQFNAAYPAAGPCLVEVLKQATDEGMLYPEVVIALKRCFFCVCMCFLDLRKFLMFVTGSSMLPAAGYAAGAITVR